MSTSKSSALEKASLDDKQYGHLVLYGIYNVNMYIICPQNAMDNRICFLLVVEQISVFSSDCRACIMLVIGSLCKRPLVSLALPLVAAPLARFCVQLVKKS